LIINGEPLFYHPQSLSCLGNVLSSKGISFYSVGTLVSLKKFRFHLHGTLKRFCMQSFFVGTDWLPFTRCLGTVLCRTVLFHVFSHQQFQTKASLSIHQEQETLESVVPPQTFSSNLCPKFSAQASFPFIVSYRQSNFPLPRF